MKTKLLLALFFVGGFVKAQNAAKTEITHFEFQDRSIPVSSLDGVKPISKNSFRTSFYTVIWTAVRSDNINEWMDHTIQGFGKHEVLDTLNCSLFGYPHKAILLSQRSKCYLLIYQPAATRQDVFVLNLSNKKKAEPALRSLESYLLPSKG